MTEIAGVADDAPDEASLQRQLLTRAGVAASLIVVMLTGLALYDHMVRPATPPPAAVAPEAPGPAHSEAVASVAAPVETKAEEADARRDAPSEPELTSAPQLAPPGQRQADAPEPGRGTSRLVLGGEAEPPPSQSTRSSAPPAARKPAPAEAPNVAGKGYLLQLGVFASLENAEALRARLESLGIPAHLESRVVMGPFADQRAARAAQARLREAGQESGLIVPPRR